MQFLRESEHGASSPRVIRALRTLITHDLSLPLYEEIERAKIELSTKDETRIRMFNRDIAINERITRAEFERLIVDELAAIGACVDRAVRRACAPSRSTSCCAPAARRPSRPSCACSSRASARPSCASKTSSPASPPASASPATAASSPRPPPPERPGAR